jgi:hypothetical protein
MQLRELFRLSKLLRINICTIIPDITITLSDKKTVELRSLSLFQNIDALGNNTDSNWFMSLNRYNTLKMLRELIDIWSYRAGLSIETKRAICPPWGNPFVINIDHLYSLENLYEIKTKILLILEKIINSGISNDHKYLGSSYVLCALTLVNNEAAIALPWLYQAVAYI